jgi:signal recognition particle GTPase
MDDLETFDARSFVTRMLGLGEMMAMLLAARVACG